MAPWPLEDEFSGFGAKISKKISSVKHDVLTSEQSYFHDILVDRCRKKFRLRTKMCEKVQGQLPGKVPDTGQGGGRQGPWPPVCQLCIVTWHPVILSSLSCLGWGQGQIGPVRNWTCLPGLDLSTWWHIYIECWREERTMRRTGGRGDEMSDNPTGTNMYQYQYQQQYQYLQYTWKQLRYPSGTFCLVGDFYACKW